MRALKGFWCCLMLAVEGSNAEGERALAAQLHSHWMNKVAGHLSFLSQHVQDTPALSMNTSAILEAQGVRSDSSSCYLKMAYEDGRVRIADSFQHHCRLPNLAQSSAHRAQLYSNIFSYIIKHDPQLTLQRPFVFMMDLTSGSQHHPELRRAFQMPTLIVAGNPRDDTVVMVPDFYMLLALLLGTELQFLIPPPLLFVARGLAPRYRISPPAWEHKIPKAVFAGHCYPTIDSSRPRAPRVPMRSMLCDRYGYQAQRFDVKTFYKNEGGCMTGQGLRKDSYCKMCKNCSSGTRISATSMLNYKYQLLVDGHGPAYDANVWKLLSRGVSFQIAPDPPLGESAALPLYNMFYSPLLQPYKNVIPTSMSGLGGAVQWCVDNDGKCAEIAADARTTIQRVLDLRVLLEYMKLVIISIHDWHQGAAAAG